VLHKNQISDFGDILIAGIDEAGRGPLAGPVVVAGVILNNSVHIPGLNDSKKLSEKRREELYRSITEKAVAWEVVIIPAAKIDEINILQATLLGMKKAADQLTPAPELCLIDGNFIPAELKIEARAIIKGDGKYASIAAASILAKVTRDRLMLELHEKFPRYNFARNKGYPTQEHLAAIRKFGIIDQHRRSFNPVKQLEFDF